VCVDSPLQLADGPHARAFALLRLFAYGELSDWIASPDSFPPLRPAHVAKLRHLTLLRLCSSARIVPYATLLEALHLDVQAPSGASTPVAQPVRALEDCIIDAVYAGILGARLDQRAARVEVQGCLGRDVGGPEEVLQLEQGLAEW
jgi:COP9 signalosome complex subunit 7